MLLYLATKFPMLWKVRRWIGYGIAALAVVWALWAVVDGYGDRRAAQVQARWDADSAARQAVADKQARDVELQDAADATRNEVIYAGFKEREAAILADSDSLSGRLRDYETRDSNGNGRDPGAGVGAAPGGTHRDMRAAVPLSSR